MTGKRTRFFASIPVGAKESNIVIAQNDKRGVLLRHYNPRNDNINFLVLCLLKETMLYWTLYIYLIGSRVWT
jgi:hypothetical protein